VASPDRRERLRSLERGIFDLVVVGGGVNGAGIAREAALRGLRTVVVDQGDFASGTSSRSSKLIHGGLRYLETGDFALVREASLERDLLRRKLAPHLVRPMAFVFPVYRGARVGWWKLQAGLLAYDLLAGFRNLARHRSLSAAALAREEPALRRDGLRGGAAYYDCWTDDARLVIETMLAAEEAGAVCLNYASVESFLKEDGRITGVVVRDREGGEGAIPLRGRLVVNATGPWLDRLRLLDDPLAKPRLRPTKGVHLVLPRERVGNRSALVLHAVRDGRVLFVIPWEDAVIVGTTDTDYAGDPGAVAADDADVTYLLETANHYFPAAALEERDVLSTFAGLRPLVSGDATDAPSSLSREEALFESESGLLSIGGGKLTTYRRIAIKVVDRAAEILARRHGVTARERSTTDQEPLPGGRGVAGASGLAVANGLPKEAAAHLALRYGARARELGERLRERPEWAEPIAPGAPDLLGEAWFGAATEWAVRIEDVVRRRTGVALRAGDGARGAVESIALAMGEALDWDEATRAAKIDEFLAAAAAADERPPQAAGARS
jgi:glycerol-3-phosphate dehydrogenase